MFFIVFMEFVAFPEKANAIFKTSASRGDKIDISSSGSLGLYFDGKCHQTYPNETIRQDEGMDWCSNIVDAKSGDKPWVSYSVKGRGMRLSAYSVRNGCCWHPCCCTDDNRIIDGACCCRLYSYSLHGSNDNKTWTLIHKVEKDDEFYDCQFKTFEFKQTQSYAYIRFMLDEEYPGCPRCMQLNQLELYGETTDSFLSMNADDESDESVSIIGKVKQY